MSTNTSFFDNARTYRSNYKDEKTWARHFARVYFHEVDSKPGFLTIYQSLLSDSGSSAAVVNASKKTTRRSVKEENGTIRVTVNVSDAKKDAVFASDGQQTDAEHRKGKYELNKFLYKAHSDWYAAFEDEVADESASGNRDNDMSVDDRWSWHAAKHLSRKTQLPADALFPIVQAWLIQRG
jgi:hypothetical protein